MKSVSSLLTRMMHSRWYPGIIQYPVLAIFIFITYELFFGPINAHHNVGTALTWVLWWPLLPLLFLLSGRFWCAICPFATISDAVQRLVGNNRPVPRFLKKYGIWLIDAFFIAITWSDHVFGIVESPRGSAFMMVLIALGAITAGAFFERRTWCRYICFLGGLAGNYSRTGLVQLRGTPSICQNCKTASCYRGSSAAKGCPMFEYVRTMDTSARCNLCGRCVKNCPNHSIHVSLRRPFSELWFITRPRYQESFLAVVIMGIVFVQNMTMLSFWQHWQTALETLLHTQNYAITFTIIFLIAMAIPVGLLYLASWAMSHMNSESTHMNFARFGYALIPLDFSAHMSHNLFHLLAEGNTLINTGKAALGLGASNLPPAVLSMGTIQILQYLLLTIGGLGSIYTAYRIAKANYSNTRPAKIIIPMLLLLVVLFLVNAYTFSQPMMHRM
ncbi:4Fe-4S binding protein [uncultured Megasphaera sp.]|uniref:4Fe-4S binding protein n=1 Tax=uncultured Megasphaera sp. TaxID=165188 RepID=UPI002658753D|nr:4Fe-4S binding protein [uncultured Megasphaera sp.]